MLQDELAKKYKYKKLPGELSIQVRMYYLKELPGSLKLKGDPDFELKTKSGTLISKGYNRIVIGDYGAFIEFGDDQVVKKNLCIKKGQEYRIFDKNFKHVKYWWLTSMDVDDVKVYFQRGRVSYADYLSGMYYVSPHDII